ncbi:MAG TPA: hypothetical protein VMC80_01905 [Patescibacteria group bacterium]|nr:hypothetical protein [Patescibacteria group bacterium]
MTIPKLNELIQKINIEDMFVKAVTENEHIFIDSLTGQLIKGEDSTGGKIGQYASNEYARYKYSLNTQAGLGNVDLKLSGDLYHNLGLVEKSKKFFFFSTVSYFQKIQNQYGLKPWGLNDENKTETSEVIKDSTLKQLRNGLRLQS